MIRMRNMGDWTTLRGRYGHSLLKKPQAVPPPGLLAGAACRGKAPSVDIGYAVRALVLGMPPSCCMRLIMSNCPRNSAILPSAMR